MISAVAEGREGTAMMSFRVHLNEQEVEQVVDFVRWEFMESDSPNTQYHTLANGWDNHQQYAVAFPFALGEIALDTPWEQLTERQQIGKRLFMSSCVTCHDRATVRDEGVIWELRAVSLPRNQYDHKKASVPDVLTQASPFARHDVVPDIKNLTTQQRRGEALFQQNCAFCHAADGTGKNWIGGFLESHPRDLTSNRAMLDITPDRLKQVIKKGLPGTTMSAWETVLTDEQINDIISYVYRAFIVPEG